MISNLCARMGLFALLLVASSTSILTQEKPKDTKSKDKAKATATAPAPAPTPDFAKSFQSAITGMKFREIGPATMGGRIDDIEVVPNDSRVIYVATAAGGILKSTNGGT